ncbi:MAG: tetratricopeptide repeat protein [Spirochaetota bacterium]
MNAGFILPVLVMGLSYSRLKNVKAAEKCFLDVIAAVPGNEVALTALAMLYNDQKKFNQALDFIDRLQAAKPGNEGARKLRSSILYALGRNTESADEIKKIADSHEGFASFSRFVQSVPVDVYSDSYGSLDEKIGKLEQKNTGESSPADKIALSLCYLFKGDTDRAVDSLFKAKE